MKKFELMTLPYAEDALEPVISSETIGFHYGKHLLTYVNNLNALLSNTPLEDLPLEEIVKKAEGGILNNAGQILNHEMYFLQFKHPTENNIPTGTIADAIMNNFGSFDAFKEEFQKKGTTLFGSDGYGSQQTRTATSSSHKRPMPPTPFKRVSPRCSPSTYGSMPTTWTIRTDVPTTLLPSGRLSIGTSLSNATVVTMMPSLPSRS